MRISDWSSDVCSSDLDSVPDRISGELRIADRRTPVTLERTPHPSGAKAIPPGGFAQAHYLLRLPADGAPRQTAILSLTTTGYASGYAFSLPDNPAILSRPHSADEPGPTVPAPMRRASWREKGCPSV